MGQSVFLSSISALGPCTLAASLYDEFDSILLLGSGEVHIGIGKQPKGYQHSHGEVLL